MKFDAVIIGGGLSGLICGIRLQKKGQKCVIVSTGHSALHFSSGSFDLCSSPEKELDILKNVSSLIKEKPNHPYAYIGESNMLELMIEAKQILTDAGIDTYGNSNKNHYRLSPMGKLVPTWLSQEGYAVNDTLDLSCKKIQVFGFDGYLDSYPHFVSDELKSRGVEVITEMVDLPILDILRTNPTGLIATSIGRELDKESNKKALLEIIKKRLVDCDAIALPACIGMDCNLAVKEYEKELGKKVILIPTLPPSVAGATMQKKLTAYFNKLGGTYMLGDTVKKVEVEAGSVSKVYSVNHTDIPFIGKNFVLATGGFFSKGLESDNKSVREPLFNLDVDYKANREDWYNKDVFQEQAYQSFGVKITPDFRGILKDQALENLYVIGATLGGYNPIKEGTGGGVSLLSALFVADKIIKK